MLQALPEIKLGDCGVSRLIIGGNPFAGNSHWSPELDDEMEDYYSTRMIRNTLARCEECGINTANLRADKHVVRLLREYRLDGGKINWIAQTVPEMSPFEANIRLIQKYKPIAIYHHGTVTDALFKAGEYGELQKRLAVIRKTGYPVGLCTHMPEVIRYADEYRWDIDFYMACVHNLSKVNRVSSAITGRMNNGEPFDDEDRDIMYDAIGATDKVCLAFKILGAGRKCESAESVRSAFIEAFERIKPTDAIVVGVFQKYKDQVSENAELVRDILSGGAISDAR
jgi:hypothetical protein